MSYIQLPYGYVENKKQVQFNLPNNYEESFYFEKAPYLTNPTPAVENKLINLIKNRDDLKKWLLATSDYGHEIQEDLNAVVGYDEKFNNAIVRHALDLKDEAIFRHPNPNPINVTFYDMKKFDQVNPVIGKLTAQVKASKLTEKEINDKLLKNWEADELQLRLDKLKYEDDDDDKKPRGGGGGGGGGTPGPGLPKTPKQEVEEIEHRLNRLRGNTPLEVSLLNTKEENSRIIAQMNWQKVLDQRFNRREKELSQQPKGNVKKKRSCIRSSMRFRLPDTPTVTLSVNDYWDDVAENWKNTPAPQDLSTPAPLSGPPEEQPYLFDYDRDFPPLPKYVQKKKFTTH